MCISSHKPPKDSPRNQHSLLLNSTDFQLLQQVDNQIVNQNSGYDPKNQTTQHYSIGLYNSKTDGQVTKNGVGLLFLSSVIR